MAMYGGSSHHITSRITPPHRPTPSLSHLVSQPEGHSVLCATHTIHHHPMGGWLSLYSPWWVALGLPLSSHPMGGPLGLLAGRLPLR